MPTDAVQLGVTLRNLLTAAWLVPLAGFVIELYALNWKWSHRLSKAPAYLAVGCIGFGFLCSVAALALWGNQTDWAALKCHGVSAAHGEAAAHPAVAAEEPAAAARAGHDVEGAIVVEPGVMEQEPHDGEPADHAAHGAHGAEGGGHHGSYSGPYYGTFYRLAQFGPLTVSLDWYIDSLTLVMFAMVTLIATCIHVFAIGYMSEELTEEYVDHEVHTRDGHHLHRPGRFHRFFAFLSLFCFSMLGLVLAGNIFQVFVFWELVGLCSYLLIGFYVERKSASTAANKAFIMNRVGDFGFLIGLMVLFTFLGTFQFFDNGEQPGLFTQIRGAQGEIVTTDDGRDVLLHNAHGEPLVDPQSGSPRTISYLLLVVAGLGVFGGCIGKSAQFPLQTWLPDAMEGPTPVSALVHSATMVAAGVYLAGRFYPIFAPEVLLAIAYIGCVTLFLAATIAIVATDIKRVLAYSTISQLGYMMLAIGVAGWGAGLFHLITHAFFKSLMFLASGSVIAGCHHVQEMTRMGGLQRKMPITAGAMLVGVIAIAGLAIPGITLPVIGPIAFSGYHSKDAIVASALAYADLNPYHSLLFLTPLATAGITSFYMFRLWFMTFAGPPKDEEVYAHCHESPWVMTGPLIVLSFFAIFCAFGGEEGPLYRLIGHSETVPAEHARHHQGAVDLVLPGHHETHAVHSTAGTLALLSAVAGMALAYALYVARWVNPADVRRALPRTYDFLADKWRFDALYDVMFVQPVHVVARWCTAFDKYVLDFALNTSAGVMVWISRWDRKFDETMVDGFVNLLANVTYAFGRSLRTVQTGRLRQYVMWIAFGVLVLFAALFVALPKP
jgi:NADH-quinone oxidoreductase subunit L